MLPQAVFRSIGRQLAPILAPLVTRPPFLRYLEGLEIYLALLQGKGAGQGWDIASEVEVAARLIRCQDPTVLDVGANVGKWSALMSKKRPDARILLFEPAAGCCETIRQLQLPNAQIIPAAVGRHKTTALLHTSSPTSDIASLYQRKDTNFSTVKFTPTEVPVVSIDEVIAQQGIQRVDFMKMDIEGAELDALQGAHESLRDGKILALSFEFGSGNINSRTFFRDFWDILHPLGFALFRITPGARLLEIKAYHETHEYFRIVSNFVAVLKTA
jgi:FkbM family methyltransferase